MNRFAKLAGVAAAGTLALTACSNSAATTAATNATSAASSAASSASSAASSAASKAASASASSSGSASASSSGSASSSAAATANTKALLACPAGKLTGEGSSAQKTALDETINGYNDKCGNKATIEYAPNGSGAGITSFTGKLVDWAGSDSALKNKANDKGVVESDAAKARCGGNDAWNLPMVVGPVAFAYNVAGVKDLVLSPEVLAKIFYGQITTWNDPAIAALNSGKTLPADKIAVFYRGEDSGTTENVAKFLKAAGKGAWADEPSKKWTGKVGEGKSKSSGVAEAVKATPNSLTYVELSFATDNGLAIASIDNGKGAVKLTPESVGKAVSGAKISGTGNDLKLDLKYTDTDSGAYPALLVTYEIVCSAGLEADKTALLKDFLNYFASKDGQDALVDLGYAPLPSDLQAKVINAIAAVK